MYFIIMMLNDISHQEAVLNGYKIRFSLKDFIILIEAENISTSKIYSVNICQSETAKITENFSRMLCHYTNVL